MSAVAGGDASDEQLLKSAGAGDQSAWDALVDRYGGRVWAVARAHRLSSADAEDVFQVAFLRLVTHLDTIRDPGRVGAWLATTARNECLRVLTLRDVVPGLPPDRGGGLYFTPSESRAASPAVRTADGHGGRAAGS